MSGFDSLVSRLSDVNTEIARLELAAFEHGPNPLKLAQISSLKNFAKKLENEWEEYVRFRQTETCRYKLNASDAFAYPARGVSRSVLDFQELFSQILDAKSNGPKQRAVIGGEIVSDSSLNLAYTFAGSLGFVFTVDSQANLFGSKYDDSIDAFFDIFSIENSDDVREMSRYLGDAVVKRTFDWSKVNYDFDFGIDVTWTNSLGEKKGNNIPKPRLGNIVEIIGRTSDVEKRTFRAKGTLLGIDVTTGRFRFAEFGTEAQSYSGPLGDEFDRTQTWEVNQGYEANIRSEAVTQYATQKTTQTYRLLSLIQNDR